MEQIVSDSFWVDLFEKVKSWLLTDFPGLLILVILFFLAFKIIRFSFKRLTKTMISRVEKSETVEAAESAKRIQTLTRILHSVTRVVLWVVLIMMILQKFGVDIAPILAGAGIVGLAVGFGAQELVRDLITGFFILLENQVRTGDVAIINGTGGLVEKIELRTITLRDLSGTVHVFQNGKINSISNMTKDWSAMVFDIGVAYKEKTDAVIEVMKDVGNALSGDPDFSDLILEPIEILGLDQFADSAIVIKARFKTRPGQQWTVGREYRKRLKAAFDEKRIEIPFPHTTIYWGEEISPLKLNMAERKSK